MRTVHHGRPPLRILFKIIRMPTAIATGGPGQWTEGPEQWTAGPEQCTGGPEQRTGGAEQWTTGPAQWLPQPGGRRGGGWLKDLQV